MEKRKIVEGNTILIGVLISYGFGAGWSTWNPGYPELVFDPTIVDLILSKEPNYKTKIVDYCEKQYPGGYFGGIDGLVVEWVVEGTEFMVEEYDGSESLNFKETIDWLTA
jgi:hypothetical protein